MTYHIYHIYLLVLPSILLDSIADCTMIRLMLKKRGLTAEIAHNGQEALRVVVGKPITHFDMIMMDKNMPVMGGIDCIKEIRQRGFDHIIVGLTAEFLSQDLKKFEEAGANLAITKPLTHQALDAILMFLDAHGVKNFSHENALLTWEFGRLIAVSTGTGTGNGTGTGTGNGTNNSAAIK
jgi:CheY-like chemotaxis protein